MIVRVRLQPVADVLLIKGVLPTSLLIVFEPPEAGGVRGEDFIGEKELAPAIETEFQLGVGNDDTLLEGIIRTFSVYRKGFVPELFRENPSSSREVRFQNFDRLLEIDIFIMQSELRFGTGGVEGLR